MCAGLSLLLKLKAFVYEVRSSKTPFLAKYGTRIRSTEVTSGAEPLCEAVESFCTNSASGIVVTLTWIFGFTLLNSAPTDAMKSACAARDQKLIVTGAAFALLERPIRDETPRTTVSTAAVPTLILFVFCIFPPVGIFVMCRMRKTKSI